MEDDRAGFLEQKGAAFGKAHQAGAGQRSVVSGEDGLPVAAIAPRLPATRHGLVVLSPCCHVGEMGEGHGSSGEENPKGCGAQ